MLSCPRVITLGRQRKWGEWCSWLGKWFLDSNTCHDSPSPWELHPTLTKAEVKAFAHWDRENSNTVLKLPPVPSLYNSLPLRTSRPCEYDATKPPWLLYWSTDPELIQRDYGTGSGLKIRALRGAGPSWKKVEGTRQDPGTRSCHQPLTAENAPPTPSLQAGRGLRPATTRNWIPKQPWELERGLEAQKEMQSSRHLDVSLLRPSESSHGWPRLRTYRTCAINRRCFKVLSLLFVTQY